MNLNKKRRVANKPPENQIEALRRRIVMLRREASLEIRVWPARWYSRAYRLADGPIRFADVADAYPQDFSKAASLEKEAQCLEQDLFRLQHNLPAPQPEQIVIPLIRPQFKLEGQAA